MPTDSNTHYRRDQLVQGVVSNTNKEGFKNFTLAREKARQVFALAERLNTLEKTVERLLQDRNV